MKRTFCRLFTLAMILSIILNMIFCPLQTAQAGTVLDENELYARSAVLMDADSGRVLFGKDEKNPMPMASTTKIMTCILALEEASLDDVVSVSAYAAKMPDVQLHILEGEHYRLKDLLYSLMLESHNDSAAAIAEHVGGSIEGFAQMMNEKAEEIGCTDTYFITPNGLDAVETVTQQDGTSMEKIHSTTAVDLARMLSYCITKSPQKKMFLKITRTDSYSFQNLEVSDNGGVSAGERSFSCNNHNAFLHMMDGALTGKTGFTGNAGYCYTGAVKNDGRTFVIALLACGWPNNKTWKWKDARKLFQYGIGAFQKTDITDYSYKAEPIPVENGAGNGRLLSTKVLVQPLVKQEACSMLLSENDKIQVRENLPERLYAPLKAGAGLGSLDYYVNGQLAARMPFYAADSVKERTDAWYFKLVLSRYFYPYLRRL